MGLYPAWPSGRLVKRGCFFGRPHPCVSFIKKLCSPSWFTFSAHTNQCCSHIILPSGYKLLAPLLVFPLSSLYLLSGTAPAPLFQCCKQNKWVTVRDKLQKRSEEGEICSCVVEQPVAVKGNPPLAQRELHLLCKEALEAFSCWGCTGPPHTFPQPLCLSPMVLTPFIVFPLLLFCPWIYFKWLLRAVKIFQNDKSSVSSTSPKVSCQTQTCRL